MDDAVELATVGDNCIDRYLAPVGLSTVGGNAVNVAAHLSALGRRVAYFGAVGADAAGLRIVRVLAERGVAIGHVRSTPGARTACSDIGTGPAGERVIAFEEFGACRDYRPDVADVADLRRMRHVHIGWLADGGTLRRRLADARVSVSQDLSVNAEPADIGAAGLTIAFVSAPGLAEAEAAVERALHAGVRVAVATCGAAGSLASDGRRHARADAQPVRVIDTLGAGDTFIAAFIDAHLEDAGLEGCLLAGSAAAARTCGHLGGFPQTPLALST